MAANYAVTGSDRKGDYGAVVFPVDPCR